MKKIFCTLLFLSSLAGAFAQENGESKVNAINTTSVEFAPTISGDGKTLIFQSNRNGGFRLYESTLQADGNWSAPVELETINKFARPNYFIGGPCLSHDGSTLYFCMLLNNTKTDMDIYVSKRNSKNVWSTPSNIGKPITTANSETFPSISPDGKKLFYTSTVVNGNGDKCSKIMMSLLNEKNDWQTPVEVPAPINSGCDKSPRVTYDNKTLLFASNKNGNYDLFRSEWSNESWSPPTSLDFANTTGMESNPAISVFEDLMYFSQNGDIVTKSIPDEFKLHGLGLKGEFKDAETNKPLEARLYLIDSIAKDTIRRFNPSTSYALSIPAGKPYKVLASSNGYNTYLQLYQLSFSEKFVSKNEPILLKPRKKEMVFKVSDKENSKGLKVKIKVTNLETKEETLLDASTGRDGKYSVSLREGSKYSVEISSSEGGYAFSTTTVEVPITATSSETIYASTPVAKDSTTATDASNVEIKLQPLKDNTKLTLNNIQFLFNKFELEEASFVELDRVVNLMKSNPSAMIEIAAHTDDVGSDDFNNKLSTKRAQEIVKYLNSKGIPSSRLKSKGYGKSRPLDTATTEEARAKNRRVELKILDIN